MKEGKKRIALFYGRNNLNDARIEYMPFVLNFIKCLDKENYAVDVYLAETKTESYQKIFSSNVNVFFIDNDFIWKRRRGRKFYYYAHLLIKLWLLQKPFKYDLFVGAGVFGNFVASILAQNKKSKYIYLGDEFPILYGEFWNNIDIESCKKADLVVVPDETRIEGTEKLLGQKLKNVTVLPNSPLISDLENLAKINWHEKLNIPDKKIILYAGGVEFFNQFLEILVELPKISNDYTLVIIAPKKYKKEFEYYLVEGRYVWITEYLRDDEFYSLLSNSFASIGLYRTDVGMLEYVGKSSGKIMRSIGCGTPVIVTQTHSLDFVKEINLGVSVKYTCFIPEAILEISKSYSEMRLACLKAFQTQLSYDVYWENFSENYLKKIV